LNTWQSNVKICQIAGGANMSVGKSYYFYVSLFCLLLISSLTQSVSGQAVTPAAAKQSTSEVDSLRSQIEEQKSEIKKLRDDLKEESELRKKQQALLDSLLKKMDKIDSALAQDAKPTSDKNASIVQAGLEKPAESATGQEKTAQNEKQTNKQTDKSQNTVETGFGKVKFTGLFQGWYAGGSGAGFNDTFRIRRAELKFTGDLLPKVKWTVMLDLAKALSINSNTATINNTSVLRDVSVNQSSRVLQEAFITLGYFKRANFNIGQFKLPVSQEALQSSSALDTVERALFLTDRSRGGGLGDVRDFGVMMFGGLNKEVDYQIGVFNGSGETQNDVDRSDQKAFAGRLVFRPKFFKGLQIGGSGVWGGAVQTNNPRRDRLGGELLFERKKLRIKSELMTGVDGAFHRRGFYAHLGYRFLPKLEGIFRFDTFDPDIRRETNAATVTERDFITGINYYIKDNNFKLQINYLRKTFTNGIVPSRNQILVNLQTSW
jgi:uncharacterized coiled-coil protein SlyX